MSQKRAIMIFAIADFFEPMEKRPFERKRTNTGIVGERYLKLASIGAFRDAKKNRAKESKK